MIRPPKLGNGGASPVKIDRTKYADQLSRPIMGDGTNVVTGDPQSLSPDVLKGMGYNYISGSLGGKDLTYEKNGNYHIYNEQIPGTPNYKPGGNPYGLINIGNPYSAPLQKPVSPITPQNQPAPQVADPMKAVGYNGMLAPIVQQFKKGGRVGYANGGPADEVDEFGNIYNGGGAGSTVPSSTFSIGQEASDKIAKDSTKQDRALSNGLGGGLSLAAGVGAQGLLNSQRDPNQFQGLANNDALLGAVGPTAANAIIPGSGALVAPILGLKKGLQTQAERVDPTTGKFINEGDAGVSSFANGLLNASPLGALGTVMDPNKSLGEKALSVGTLGLSNLFTSGYDKDQTEQRNVALANKNNAAALAARNKVLGDASVAKAFSDRTTNGYFQGGQIEGKGTAKSDSIKAKVAAGSFIVPAENAPIAETIRTTILKAPSVKANINQKGGTEVKLSNGESMFTPEEVEELTKAGIDLAALAPHAKNAVGFADGGLTPEKAALILRDGHIKGKKISEKQRKYFGYISSQK